MLEEFGTALTSILTGGATGLIGSVISRVADFKIEKMRLEHALATQKIESEASIVIARSQAAAQEAGAAYEALGSSHDADKASYMQAAESPIARALMTAVDFVRGITRPLLTLYLVVATSWMSYVLYRLVQEMEGPVLGPMQVLSLWSNVIDMVLYLTASAVLWWFGGRAKAPER